MVKALLLCALFLIPGCSSPQVDLEKLTLSGMVLQPDLNPQDAIRVLGPPDEETRPKRWMWRTARLNLKYYRKGVELSFDSTGQEYDPSSAKFFLAYIFLRPEGKYRAFAGSLSQGISGEWDLVRLEKALGPPDKTREADDEVEWIYGEQKPVQTIFISDASKRTLKALMIIRRDKERPTQ